MENKPRNNKTNRLVVLDIDNTLLHTVPCDDPLVSLTSYASEQQSVCVSPVFDGLNVIFRPWLRHFFLGLQLYDIDIAIWSAGSEPYVRFVAQILAICCIYVVSATYQGSFCHKAVSLCLCIPQKSVK